jgi:hypothetical protein
MKAKKILTIVVTVLAVGMATFSAIMKFQQGDEVMKGMSQFGVGDHVLMLGVMEITFAALFAFSKTMKLGFILLSCYFAGALATELSHGMPFNALTPLVLVWIAAFLRDRSIFLPVVEHKAE